MEFSEALNKIQGVVNLPQGIEFDGIIVKKMAATNIPGASTSSHQSHIAITGQQMDMFPCLYSQGYFGDEFDQSLKKYLFLQVPFLILEDGTSLSNIEASNVSVVRSRREDGTQQLQLSLIDRDSETFIQFRRSFRPNDFLVVLKVRNDIKYLCARVEESDSSNTVLSELNGKFFKQTTSTAVQSNLVTEGIASDEDDKKIVLSCDDPDVNEEQYRNWMSKQEYEPGHFYKPSTINNYSLRLKDAVSILQVRDQINHDSLFEVYTYSEMKNTVDLMVNMPGFKEKNEETRRFLKNGLLSYLKFLEFVETTVSDKDILRHNLWGLHIAGKNDALSEDNPHICIGWSKMGDLSRLNSLDDFKTKYRDSYEGNSETSVGRATNQIKRFVCDVKVGDYVIYSDSSKINIGRIESEYQYLEVDPDKQDADFVNNRKVTWLKKDYSKDELSNDLKKALGKRMTIFGLNDFKSVVIDILGNQYFADDVEDDSDVFNFNVTINKNFGYDNNRIIFGAPGTGKSFFVKSEKKKLLGENSVDFERVTFHSDYSYAQFVGTYKPVSYEDEDGNKKIEYKFVPGPFARILCKALKNIKESVKENGMIDNSSVKPYLLIIEEINRAKTSAVFGDVFQLLDRDNNGLSEYSINPSEDLKKYLAKELEVGLDSVDSIRIPSNMFIWATMNSADQGVFPMDTAFKRRWNFAYTDVDSSANENEFSFIVKGEEIEWNAIRKAINDVLCGETIRAHEDKLLGAFFMKKIKDSVSEEETEENKKVREEKNNVIYVRNFTDKVLMYLFDDVAKTHRDAIFDVQVVNRFRFSSVKEKFLDQGLAIFSKDVNDKYKSYLTGKKVEK